jgi:hypothetical protein
MSMPFRQAISARESAYRMGGEFAKSIGYGPFRAVLRAKVGMVPFHSCANCSSSRFI